MLTLTAGAFAIGLALSLLLPFLAFAGSLVAAVAIGIGSALVQGRAAGETALVAVVVLVACQLGYGLGLVAATAVEKSRRLVRSRRAGDGSERVERLRHERE